VKKLLCIYADKTVDSQEKLDALTKSRIYGELLKNQSVKIVVVYGNSHEFKVEGDNIYLPCQDRYDALSIKTYQMISHCYDNFEFDVLFKVDVSLIGYVENSKAGYRKEVRQHFYDVNRVLSLVKDDTWIRARKDYGGALLQGRGNPLGHHEWAKAKKIENYNYHSEFGESNSPNIYSGKFYFVSRKFAEYIKNFGENLALRHFKNLGGAEDIMIARLYSQFIHTTDWITSSRVYLNDHNRFLDFRDGSYDKTPNKSLYIASDEKRYIWFVVPKAASRSLFKILGREPTSEKHSRKRTETREHDQRFFNNPSNKQCRDDYFKFTFVRDPVSRLYSTYLDKVNHCTGTEWELPFYAKFYGKSFEYFVDYIYNMRNQKHLERHIRPQVQLINNLESLDFVGKLESFDKDVVKLTNIMGIPHTPQPHENKSHGDAQPPNKNTIRKIKEIYHADFQSLGYD
jgi:hypothetical protein